MMMVMLTMVSGLHDTVMVLIYPSVTYDYLLLPSLQRNLFGFVVYLCVQRTAVPPPLSSVTWIQMC